jgi:hypothetical protein
VLEILSRFRAFDVLSRGLHVKLVGQIQPGIELPEYRTLDTNVKRIAHRLRWWIALIADLALFVPSSIKSGFWQRIPTVDAWTWVFWISLLGLIPLGIVQLWDWLQSQSTSIRRGAPFDPALLIETEKQERIRAVESLAEDHYAAVVRIDQSIRDLDVNLRDHIAAVVPKPILEPTLKERTTNLANELFALLKKEGPKPPNPLSQKGGIDEQNRAMETYFDWQNSTYYQYMAFFRDRVIKTDYELAAAGIHTKLTRPELDPLTEEVMENHDVDIKKIAEALLLTANLLSE